MTTNNETPLNVYQALSAVMADLPAVPKTVKKGSDIKYKYRGIDDLTNAIQPLLAKHKLLIVPADLPYQRSAIQEKSGRESIHIIAQVTWDIYGPDGSHIQAASLGESADSRDKATGKLQSYAYKALLSTLFCVPTSDTEENEQINTPLDHSTTRPLVEDVAPRFTPADDEAAVNAGFASAIDQEQAYQKLKLEALKTVEQLKEHAPNDAIKKNARYKVEKELTEAEAAKDDGKILANLTKSAYSKALTALETLKEADTQKHANDDMEQPPLIDAF